MSRLVGFLILKDTPSIGIDSQGLLVEYLNNFACCAQSNLYDRVTSID
ncbi:MAG: hypothetical protein KME22_20475 [Hassallia sp. WJT32-NPBG1]|nr:hypothetical protein [Hassallia sp. WJT32-NPBG1]